MNRDYQLLHAALDPGQSAIDAWRDWHDSGQLELMGGAAFRLLPLVHSNLTSLGYDSPELAKIKGIRRKLWVEGEQRIFNALPVIRQLQERFGKVIFLKGAPLGTLYYKDLGLRPMSDLDLWIEEKHALAAITFLQEAEWKLDLHPTPFRIDEEFLTFRHGVGFKGPGNVEVDLHWHLSYYGCKPGIDAPILDAVVPFHFRQLDGWTLSATDHVFHAMLHGMQYNAISTCRWVADVAYLMRHDVDWKRVAWLTEHYGVGPYIEMAAEILRREFHFEVPPLYNGAPGWWLRREIDRETGNWQTLPFWKVVPGTMHRYSRSGASLWNVPRLLRYCLFQWDLTTREGWISNVRRLRF